MGQIFQVKYMLKVYLKHEGFFERGQGNCVNLPLRILARQHLDPSTEGWRIPQNWNPHQGTAEPTYLYLQNPEVKPDYMTKFIDRNWARWMDNVSPIIVSAAEEAKNAVRRLTEKMNEDDPDEEMKT